MHSSSSTRTVLLLSQIILRIKGTVSVISSDPPFKDVNVRLTTIPWKPLSDQKCGRHYRFSDSKVFNSENFSPLLLISKKCVGDFGREQQMKIKSLKKQKHVYIFRT